MCSSYCQRFFYAPYGYVHFLMFWHFIPATICQALAKEILMSRKAVNRLYENKAQLNSISMHLGESVGMLLHSLTCIHTCHSSDIMPDMWNETVSNQNVNLMKQFQSSYNVYGIINVISAAKPWF